MSKQNENYVQLFFGSYKSSITVNCFYEDSELSIVIRDNGKKAVYTLSMWEVGQLKKFLYQSLKNEKDANKNSVFSSY